MSCFYGGRGVFRGVALKQDSEASRNIVMALRDTLHTYVEQSYTCPACNRAPVYNCGCSQCLEVHELESECTSCLAAKFFRRGGRLIFR